MAHHSRVEPFRRRSAGCQRILDASKPDRLITERGLIPAIAPLPSTSSANPMQTTNPAAAGSIPLAQPAPLQSKPEQ
jgi:hypothetical protein